MTRKIQTVTNGDWGVSYALGAGSAVLHVYKVLSIGGRTVISRGDAYGKQFPSMEAAERYALEHGYLKAFVKPWCSRCRELHWNRYGSRPARSAFCDKHNEFVFDQSRPAVAVAAA